MSNALVVSSSTLVGGVLTVVFKVSATASPVENFDLTLNFDPSKVASISGAGPGAGFSDASNATQPGQFLLSSFMTGSTAISPGQTAFTVTITLANPADTTFQTHYELLYNADGSIPDTPIELGHNFFNSPVQGLPAISGALTENAVLSALTSGISDGDGLGAYSYQWLRDGAAISGANSGTYQLGDADVGKKMSVRVSYTDGSNHTETITSAQSVPVANVNDALTGNVAITGAATVGATLTAANTLADADGLGTIAYQWKADGVAITGATASSYQLTAAELGKVITVSASYTDGWGTNEVTVSAATAAVEANHAPTGTVTISNTSPAQGQTLNASNTLGDSDGLGTVAYQWLANGTAITGATNSTLVLTQAEVNKTISVKATYTDALGKVESVTSNATSAVQNVNDAPQGAVTITGTAAEDQILTVGNTLTDIDGPGTVSYQWKANGVAITGATGTSLTLTQAEVGKTITVTASYTDGFGANESKTSAATVAVANLPDAPQGTVTLGGSAVQGQTLTASNTLSDEDGLGTIGYQWKADGAAIAGATNSSFVLTQAQVGKVITVTASYTDGQGTQESKTSTASTSIQNINDLPTGTLVIGGYAAQNPSKGQTLTISNTLADLDGLGAFSYQWMKNGTAITGATNSTYVLQPGDVDGLISVKVTYTDGFGAVETVTSAQTGPVQPNSPPGGTVTITGNATQNQTLSASNALSDADGMGTVSYQWLAGGVAITGATGSTLALTESHVGKLISVRASYTDGFGTPEFKDSASVTVANVNDPLTGNITIDKASPKQGDTLSVANTFGDIDGLGTVSYQWLADGAAITGATSSTFTLTQAQVNKAITVKGTYVDGHGTTETKISAATARVANVNDAATGAPVISNVTTATQGQTLTVNTSSIADIDGVGTFSFQWLAAGVAIGGATSSSFTLTEAQVGKAVTVKATFTDGFGSTEQLISSATNAVINVNDAPTGNVTIDGAKIVGMPLSANASTVADLDGRGTLSYQWLSAGIAVTGATLKDFTPTAAQADKDVSVKITYTDGHGTVETLTSAVVKVVNEDAVTSLAPAGTTPTAGDGNGDGIKDSAQAAVVSAPMTLPGSNTPTFITLVADASTTGSVNNGSTAVIQTFDQQGAPTTKPSKLDAPMGLIDFTATTTVGQTETFSLFVDKSLGVNGYWKLDSHGHWVNLASKPYGGATTTVGNKIRLDFKITDGGQFDNDHKADGIITDPALIGSMPLSLIGYAPDVVLTPSTHFFF